MVRMSGGKAKGKGKTHGVENEEKDQGTDSSVNLAQWVPPCMESVSACSTEYERRRIHLLKSLLCAALWPNVALRKPAGQMSEKNQGEVNFHPHSLLGLQQEKAAEAEKGDWNCPNCGFFCFSNKEWCPKCETEKPPPAPKSDSRPLKHRAFVYSEKSRSVPNPSNRDAVSKVFIKDSTGVPLKAVLLFAHKVQVDFIGGLVSVDNWIHCNAGAQDMALLIALRRRLKDLLGNRIGSLSELSEEDRDIINAVANSLVLDAE